MTDRIPPDARTVLPGQPVTYHATAPAGCIVIGAPIPPQLDPAAIVGVIGPPQPAPEYPAIPEPGFYWAIVEGSIDWEPVMVIGRESGGRRVERIGDLRWPAVLEWGPKLEPPR